MEYRELTKEDIDKVRDIDGFPIGEDEDIIALSNPPYYTACPNPFIKEFIDENGTPYDEENDNYHSGPYTYDVSEDKHDKIYNIHSYHTKVPPKAIMKYINYYTNDNDIVLDCFCGSRMTGIATQLNEYKKTSAILIDLSSYASFISGNYNTPNTKNTISTLDKIINEVEEKYGKFYKTKHDAEHENKDINGNYIYGDINYVVWSCIYYCPNCSKEINYYDVLEKKCIKSTQKKISCPNCNMELERNKLEQKKRIEYEYESNCKIDTILRIPVLINYSIGSKRYTKKPDKEDIKLLREIGDINLYDIPKDKIIHGDETERLFKAGINYISQLYIKRTLLMISKYIESNISDTKKEFLLTSVLPKLTILNRYMPEHGSRALVGPRTGTYYLPPICVENNVIKQLRFQLNKLKNLAYKKGNVITSTQSATDLSNISNNSIDYIFIDPPFGANIMYSELNYTPESWLKIKTNNKDEAIINKSQHKKLNEYQDLITSCLKELYRVIKPNRWITIEFHNSKNIIWNAIQQGLNTAGFIIADIRILNKEKKTINQYSAKGSVDQDLIISAYKPKNRFKEVFINQAGSENTVWCFISQHLENLPVVVIKNNMIEIVAERQPFLLFDRMVAYHIMNGISVPIDAPDFYKGLDERYLQRDGMYFLPDQVNEYDTVRIINDVEPIQFEMFVTNEKSAISWLYKQLETPHTYAEIQPKFMQELKAIDKFEKVPELSELLEENFLQNDEGEWYIPDRTREADVTKLREKKLIKEFEGYLDTKGKLKLFRSEAIRIGFSKLWKDQNYKLIVEIAERLPEKTIQEDDKLLMYYDISLGRI